MHLYTLVFKKPLKSKSPEMSDWLKKVCNVNIMQLIFIKDNYLGNILWSICLFMVFGVQMELDVIKHQGVWKGKSRICITPSMVAFNPLMKRARISWGLGGNSGARAKGDMEFILFWVGFMSWFLAFHTDEFYHILTCIMAFFLPNKGKAEMCNVLEGYKYIKPGQKTTAFFLENI